MGKLMIFCTCAEYKKEHYLERVSNWYHNLKMIKSLEPLDPDFYVFNDGVVTSEDIKAIDESMLKDPKLIIINQAPMLGRLADLTFPGWVRSFQNAITIGLQRYDYIVHIENDVLLLHPDKIVSYFDKPGMFCSKWKGRDVLDSTVMVMNDKKAVSVILAFLRSKDYANNMLIEGILAPLAPWQFVFNGDRLNGELSHLTMDLDFIAQLWRSEIRNPYSAAIMDARINHIFIAGGDDLKIPDQKHYIGIQCRSITTTRNKEFLIDNDDDNIAEDYKLYGPLTALYWIWKHHHTLSEDTGVGFFCNDMWLTNGMMFRPNCTVDRKYPCYTDVMPIAYSADRKLACNPEYTFDHYDIVIPRRQIQYRGGAMKNVIAFMVSEFSYEFYTELEKILRDHCYDYAYDIWKDYAMDELSPQVMHLAFVTTWHNFKRYCELLFEICSRLQEKFGEEKLLQFYYGTKNGDTHIFLRLAVYILNLFIYRNKLVVKETGMVHFTHQGGNYEQPFST